MLAAEVISIVSMTMGQTIPSYTIPSQTTHSRMTFPNLTAGRLFMNYTNLVISKHGYIQPMGSGNVWRSLFYK